MYLISKNIYLCLILSLFIFTSGCSFDAIRPVLEDDTKFNPSDANTSKHEIKCITNDYVHARYCAFNSLYEIGNLLEATGDYDRGSAYIALALGTITGTTLAFDWSDDILKGLSVLSGGLLGMNSVVDTASQRTILRNAADQLLCMVQNAEVIHGPIKVDTEGAVNKDFNINTLSIGATDIQLTSFDYDKNKAKYNFLKSLPGGKLESSAFLKSDGTGIAPDNIEAYKNALIKEEADLQSLNKIDNLSNNSIRLLQSVLNAKHSIGKKLSEGTLTIRMDVRRKLAGLIGDPDEIRTTQIDRIVSMSGDIIKKRSQVLADLETKPLEGDADGKKTIELGSALVSYTSDIASAFSTCVPAAIQKNTEEL